MARALECPRCGGPLPARARRVVVVCAYCGATVSLDGEIVKAADFRRARAADSTADGAALVTIADEPYVVRGRLGTGASSDVFWGERARRCRERVVIKIARSPSDELFDREWGLLTELIAAEARGFMHFRSLVPELVARSLLAPDRRVHVFRLRSGFFQTLGDVADAFGARLDPRHAVWMWRRVLEILAWVHDSGLVHGAVLPEHVLVHARDHGAMLVGWSTAERTRETSRLRAVPTGRDSFYPKALLAGEATTSAATDLVMLARTIVAAVGDGSRMPGPLGELLAAYALEGQTPPTDDALDLHARVGAAAKKVFGPPTYVPFEMPVTR